MKKFLDYISLLAVILLVAWKVSDFRRVGSFVEGPINPYVFFSDEVRLALEKASAKVLNGELSNEEARWLLEKYDVRRCEIHNGTVWWTIPYFGLPFAVHYIYSFDKPYPDAGMEKLGWRPLWNNWYWVKAR